MKPTQQILMSLGVLTLSTCIAAAQDSAPKGEGGGRIAEFLKRADTNVDGKISLEEFNEFSKRDTGDRFSKMDANSDGFVDSTEMGQIGERLREGMRRPGGEGGSGSFRRPGAEGGEGGFRRPPGGSPEGERPAPKPEGERPAPRPEGERPMPPEGQRPGGPGGMGINIDEVFGRMDKNADGNVDKDEYIEFSKQEIETRFGRMDENTDGKVSKDEMKSGMERMRNMMRGPGGPGGPGGMRRPGVEGGPGGPPGGGEGGFRRPPTEGGTGRPRPEAEADAPKKDPA